jgi:hypothetical protein
VARGGPTASGCQLGPIFRLCQSGGTVGRRGDGEPWGRGGGGGGGSKIFKWQRSMAVGGGHKVAGYAGEGDGELWGRRTAGARENR